MGDNPVQLDFSKAQPISGQPQSASPGVSRDFSQAQHLDQQPSQPSQESQPFTDEHLEHIRQLNENRPWWRKMLGLGPSDDQMTAQDKVEQQQFWDDQKTKMTEALRDNYKARADVPVGSAKAAGRSAVGAANLAIKGFDVVTGANKPSLTSLITGKTGHEIAMPKALESDGSFGQEAGGLFESTLEFLSGDEALKALSSAEKFKLGAKIATLAEEHPAVAKLIQTGLNATRTGVVSGAQEAVHGGDTGDVLAAAGTGGLTSAASEGLGALAKLAKNGVTKIAGETLSTSPAWKGAGTAAKLAAENQEPAKKVLSNVAHDAADAITQKFGTSAPEEIATFHDAAEEVKKAAQPVFKALDTLPGHEGEFQTATNELNSANKVARRATSMKDLQDAEKAATVAQAKIDKIFSDSAGKIAPEDLQNARSAWKSKITLNRLGDAVDKAFDIPQAASDISGTSRTLDLSKLQGRLNTAFSRIPKQDLENVLGSEGTKNLFELAKLGADPARAKTLGEIATQIGSHLSVGGAGTLIGAAAGHAIPGGSIALGAHFLYSHPEAGQLVVQALSKGTNPKLVVPAVIKLIDSQRESKSEQ